MLGGIGVQEILIILVVGLLVFGAARLPKIARSLGLGIKEFKKTIKGMDEDEEESGNKIKYVQNQTPVYQGQQPQQQYGQGMNPSNPQAPPYYSNTGQNTQQGQQNPGQPGQGQEQYQQNQEQKGNTSSNDRDNRV